MSLPQRHTHLTDEPRATATRVSPCLRLFTIRYDRFPHLLVL